MQLCVAYIAWKRSLSLSLSFFSEDVTPGCQLCSKSCFGNPASSGGVCCRYLKLHTGRDASLVFLFPKDEDEDRTLACWGGEAGAQGG